MSRSLKKIRRALAQGTLSLLAFAFLLVILLQIGLTATILWLNTGKGRAIVESQLRTALSDSNSDLTIGRLFYDPASGLTLYNLLLTDEQGPQISLDRLTIRPHWSDIFARHLNLTIDGGTLAIHRLPTSPDTEEREDGLAPFTLPDLYFTRATISRLSFAQLALGTNIIAAPRLYATAQLTAMIDGQLTLEPQIKKADLPVPPPEKLAAHITFDPQSLLLTLQDFTISAALYNLTAQGQASLAADGPLALTATGHYSDLTALTGNQLARTNFTTTINGTTTSPAVTLNAQIEPAALAERGLGTITLTATPDLQSEHPTAAVTLTSTYQDKPVTLATTVIYNAPALALTAINATAPAITAKGDLAYNTQDNELSGQLALDATDLALYSDLIDHKIAGKIDATLTATAPRKINLAFNGTQLQYAPYQLAKINGDITLADFNTPTPTAANITLANLQLADNQSIRTATLKITQQDNTPEIYNLSLSATAALPQDFTLDGTAAFTSLTAPLPTVNNINLTAKLAQSTAQITGALNHESVNLTLATKNFQLAALPVTLPQQLTPVTITGTATMQGPVATPHTNAQFTLHNLDSGNYKDLQLALTATHAEDNATLHLTGTGPGIRTLTAEARTTARLSLYPFAFSLPETAPLTGQLNANLDLAPFTRLALPPTQSLTGALAANATIGGTIKSPAINGTAQLTDGLFHDEPNGIHIAALNASTNFTETALTINSLTATDGESGTLTGNGTLSFSGTGTIALKAQNFHLPQSTLADGIIDADLSLREDNKNMSLAGTITINRMDITIPERFQSNIPTLNIIAPRATEKAPAQILTLGITVNADNRIYVRGWGLDAEFGGTIEVTGDATAPHFDGTLNARRGRYEEFGKRFALDRAELRFQGTIPPSPYLDIEATTPAGDVTAAILLTGPVGDPKIKFSAVPALPEDEVLSRILFGRTTARITPLQAVQLTNTLRRFSGKGGGGFDPLGTLRGLTGFDNIAVDTDESGATQIGVGRYLSDKVYLEFKGGSGEASGAANLQFEITPQISAETEIGQDARAGGGIFWRRDY